MTKKLYKVTCRGMRSTHGTAYVVANDAGDAYARVRAELDKRDLGFTDDREMESVELIAEDCQYPSCKVQLYT